MAKVLHVSTVRQGLEVRAFHHECRSLRDAGFAVEFVVHNGPHDAIVEGISVRTLGPLRKQRRGLLPFARASAFLRALYIVVTTPSDLVHLHDPELIPLGVWLKLTSRRRVVYDSAENYAAYMLQKQYLPALLRWILFGVTVALEKVAGWLLDAVITADESTSAVLRSRGAKRVLTLHNFPRLSLFQRQTSERLLDEMRDANELKEYDLVYHGSVPKYHLEIAFDIAETLKRRGTEIRWLIFGSVDDLSWASQQIRDRDLTNNFTIQGSVDHSEVPPLVRKARMGVIPLPDLPKFRHNIPMKLFEFMALEMPVVLSDLPPSRRFVGDGDQKCALMVAPGDADSFADAIELLLRDRKLREQMGAAGRKRIENQFNWDTESRKLVSLYRELLPQTAHSEPNPIERVMYRRRSTSQRVSPVE